MEINKKWEMPNSNTFDIKCISSLIHKYHRDELLSIDPFANKNRIAKITNDLDPEMETDYCMDALEFLKQFESNSVDFVLYDPPYSPRQVSECYKKMGLTVNMQTTQASFWGNLKKEISRIVKPNGVVISFGWNSNGIGKTNGFHQKEILIVAHGGHHNDTICVVESKGEIENTKYDETKSLLYTIYMAGFNHGSNDNGFVPKFGTFEAFERTIRGESPMLDGQSWDIKDKVDKLLNKNTDYE